VDPTGNTVIIDDGGLLGWLEYCKENSDLSLALGQSDIVYHFGPNGLYTPTPPQNGNSSLAISDVGVLSMPDITILGVLTGVDPLALVTFGLLTLMLTIPSDSSLDQNWQVKAPGKPTEKDGYVPPKNWDGKLKKSQKGNEYGYPDHNGNVWVPSGGPTQGGHGGPHWDVQKPGGGYDKVFPAK